MVAVRIIDPGDIQGVGVARDPGQRRASGDDFGAQIGAALEHAGHVLGSLGALAQNRKDHRQAETDAIAEQRWKIESNQHYFNSVTEAKKSAGAGAPDFYSSLQSEWTKDSAKRLEEFSQKYGVSKDGMKKLELADLELQGHYGSQAVTYENNEAVRFLGETTTKSINDTLAGTAAYGKFADGQKAINDQITAAGRALGPDDEDKLREESRKGIVQSFTTWSNNIAAKGFADRTDFEAKLNTFDSEVKSLDITDSEKDLLRAKFKNDAGITYAKQHPDEVLSSAPQQHQPETSGGFAGAVRSSASELGINPVDLATVMSYETGGTFNPGLWGGKGGNYLGLIQAGPAERKQYGFHPGQSRDEQMKSVVAFLKDRGVKPGMGLSDIYSTINAGSPGHHRASDRPGYTIDRHVAEMSAKGSRHVRNAQRLLGGGEISTAGNSSMPPTEGPFSGMTADAWLDAQSHAQSAQNQADRDATAHANLVKAQQKDHLSLGIETGQITSDHEILGDTSIDEGDKATLLSRLHKKNKDEINQSEALQKYLGGTLVKNPFDGETKKNLDLVDAAISKAKPNITDAEHGAVWRDMADTAGAVSTNAINWMRNQVASKDPDKAAAAYALADDIQNRAPQALTSRDGGKQLADDAVVFRHFTKDLGYEPKQAVDLINQQNDPSKQRDVKTLGSQADAISKDFTTSKIADLYDYWLTADRPNIGYDNAQATQILGDYREFFRNRFVESGNKTLAEALADEDMKKIYGTSNVSGSRTLMRYPPENYAPPVAGSKDYLQGLVLEQGREAARMPDLKPGDVFLWYNDNTAAQARLAAQGKGGPPSYALYYFTEENGQRIVHRAQKDFQLGSDDVSRAQAGINTQDMQSRQEHQQMREAMPSRIMPAPNMFDPRSGNGLFSPNAPTLPSGPEGQPSATAGAGVSDGADASGAPPARPGSLESLKSGEVPGFASPPSLAPVSRPVKGRRRSPRPGDINLLKQPVGDLPGGGEKGGGGGW